ncbi:divergent polysaccharide deacetylase family protein [Bradyrhizobium prioriisuperbiae]|uniref:divergent polysaccharide deacetylase family protein n=1 Tax=Bradyrhizobium prioriisuperbiae TaxID=2854389 RepID=UPI0028E3DCE6|nr:divergent polysaccharide deacetylase family protein [Bradyrhizobium prioritasuperba]
MTTDDLSAPLGQSPARKPRFRLPLTAPQALASGLALFLAVFAGFALFNDNPLGGEPVARVTYDPGALPGDKTPAAPPVASAPKQEPGVVVKAADPPAGQKTVTIIDGSSGARRDVVVGGGDAAKTDIKTDGDAPSTAVAVGINPRLLESSRYGMIPVIADGLKPFRAYAGGSDAERAKAAKMPSIAIVVQGLGVGASKTADAIVKLPAAVTLAFTPYGADPAKLAERARAQKHELLLQVPMEPFDYPDNDPGPQTLLTSLAAEQNLDRLSWHLSRIQGYVGLANFMGGRFVASDPAMQLVVKEAAKRGLSYLDDGSSARSVAAQAADSAALPFAKADASIDAVPTAPEIDRALAKLESIAKERGTAIGVASALPISVERIGNWSKTLESRGIMLVPLTTVMLKSKSS